MQSVATSFHVITEHHTKPRQSDDLIAMLGEAISESRAHAGCEEITIRQDQDDPAHIASLTTWTTRRHYEDDLAWPHRAWRYGRLRATARPAITIHYYDAVEFK